MWRGWNIVRAPGNQKAGIWNWAFAYYRAAKPAKHQYVGILVIYHNAD